LQVSGVAIPVSGSMMIVGVGMMAAFVATAAGGVFGTTLEPRSGASWPVPGGTLDELLPTKFSDGPPFETIITATKTRRGTVASAPAIASRPHARFEPGGGSFSAACARACLRAECDRNARSMRFSRPDDGVSSS